MRFKHWRRRSSKTITLSILPPHFTTPNHTRTKACTNTTDTNGHIGCGTKQQLATTGQGSVEQKNLEQATNQVAPQSIQQAQTPSQILSFPGPRADRHAAGIDDIPRLVVLLVILANLRFS